MIDSLLPVSPPVDPGRWRDGIPGDARVGDLWVVSWDGTEVALVLIAASRPDHVLIWPVTDASLTPSAPDVKLDAEWLTADLIAWPEAEAGMSKALLDRRLGPVLADRTMLAIRLGMVDGNLPTDVAFAEERDDEEANSALDRVCRSASALCEIEWTAPTPGLSPIDPAWARDHKLTLVLGELVGGPPAVIRDLAAGLRPLPAAVVDEVTNRFDVAWTEFLAPIAGDEVAALNDPSRKHLIVDICERAGQGEAEVRSAAWQKSMRAARQSAGGAKERVAARIDQALEELLAESAR